MPQPRCRGAWRYDVEKGCRYVCGVHTLEGAREIALQHVKKLFVYSEYASSEPVLTRQTALRQLFLDGVSRENCLDCWLFTYEFKVDDYPAGVGKLRLTVHVIDGRAGHVVMSEMASRKDPGENARLVARKFILESPTYRFDGYGLGEGEALFPDAVGLEGCVQTVFNYTSRAAGYGDRSGKILGQALTAHASHVTVCHGAVASGNLDGRWDMIRQEPSGHIPILPVQSKALKRALEFAQKMPEYAAYRVGPPILVNTSRLPCPDCIQVNLRFSVMSMKNLSVTDTASLKVALQGENVTGTVFSQ